MKLKVTIKDVGEKDIEADQVITPAGTGLVLFQVTSPSSTPTALWVNLTELICVEIQPDPPPAPVAEPKPAEEPKPQE